MFRDYLIVIGLALMPALGNFLGGLLAEFRPPSPRGLNWALHAAAGVVLAVVAVELMPRVLQSVSSWVVGAAFGLGGTAYLGLQAWVERLQKGYEGVDRTGMWMVYVAVATDLFSDGLMIGTGFAVSGSLAFVLALGQVLADLPEGFATIANLKDKGVPRRRRCLLSMSFALPALLAATLAYFLLRDQSEALKLATLVFTAGLLMVAAVEDMVSEAHESTEDTRISVLALVGGFVLFTLVSAGFS